MSQRSVEVIVGRLITDEEFRRKFTRASAEALDDTRAAGLELSDAEIHALLATDVALWARVAMAVDPRLQKASLRVRTGDRKA